MAVFERRNGAHLAARVRTHDEAEIAVHRRLVEDGTDGWREVEDPSEPKKLTPKQRLQADAAALGLSDEGTVEEITARIDAHVSDLLKQAAELGIDTDKLTAVEVAAAVDAALAAK